MYEQVSYDVFISNQDGSKVQYECGVIQRVALTNGALVELDPGESINDTRDSRCWTLEKGEYTIKAVYHTSKGERITKPYWHGEVQSNEVTITVE